MPMVSGMERVTASAERSTWLLSRKMVGMMGVRRRSRLDPILRYSTLTGSIASESVREGITIVSPW